MQCAPQRALTQSADLFEEPKAAGYFHFLLGSFASLDNDPRTALEHFQYAAQFDKNSFILQLKQAEELTNLSQVAPAKEILGRLEKNGFQSADLFILKARVSSQDMDLDGSLKALDKATTLYLKAGNASKARETVLTKVALLADYKRYPESVKTVEKFLKSQPDDEIAYYFLGKIHAMFQNREQAKKAFQKAVNARPGFTAATKALGLQWELEGNIPQALKVYQRALSLNATDEELLQKLINLSLIGEDYASALDYLKQYLMVQPDDLQNQMRAALIHYKLKHFDEARLILEDMLKNEEAARDRVLFYLANVYEEENDLQKAVGTYEKISDSSDYFVESQLQIASLLSTKLEQPAKALETLRAAIALKSENEDLYLALAALHEKQNQLSESVRVLTQASNVLKNHEKILFMLGTFLDRLGDADGGIETMQRVLVVNPNNAHALNHIGYSYAERKINFKEAETFLKRAVQLEPASGFILDSLGRLYYQMGQFKKSVRILEKANKLSADQPVILEHLADAYQKVGQTKQALAIYRKIVGSSKLALHDTETKSSAEDGAVSVTDNETKSVQDRVRTKLALLDHTESN